MNKNTPEKNSKTESKVKKQDQKPKVPTPNPFVSSTRAMRRYYYD